MAIARPAAGPKPTMKKARGTGMSRGCHVAVIAVVNRNGRGFPAANCADGICDGEAPRVRLAWCKIATHTSPCR